MKYFLLFISVLTITCSSDVTNPQKIIDKSIEVAGGTRFLKSTIEFDFRDRHYITGRTGGTFSHERIFKDSAVTIHDHLTNDGFYREINNVRAAIPDSMAAKYTRSVNSTIYFALLPYGLNDPAVKKKLLGKTSFDGQSYFTVQITFEKEGGGEDFNDIFLYWIHESKFTIDYMAYLYYTDGGGLRLRKATNPRKINGILFQDYINYEPKQDSVTIDMMEALYKQNALEELSRIELKNIKVY
jgi:hypothetical protein